MGFELTTPWFAGDQGRSSGLAAPPLAAPADLGTPLFRSRSRHARAGREACSLAHDAGRLADRRSL